MATRLIFRYLKVARRQIIITNSKINKGIVMVLISIRIMHSIIPILAREQPIKIMTLKIRS